jgi:inner membrane transporter RhtA
MIDLRGADRTVLAALAIVGAQVSNALGAALSKTLFPAIGAEGVVALRLGFSAILLFGLARAWRLDVPRAQWPWLVAFGVCLGLMNSVAYQAFARIPIGIGMAIEVLGPLTVVLLSSRRAGDLAWLAGLVLGLGLLLYPGAALAPLDPLGIAFAFCSATCWGSYIVLGRRVARLGGGEIAAAGVLVASTFVVPFGVWSSGPAMTAPPILALGFAVAILSSAVPYFFQILALRQLPAGIYAVIASSMPAVGAAMSWLVLGEALSLRQAAGIACVVAAAGGCTWRAARASSAA